MGSGINAEYMGSVVNIKQLSRFKMNQIILIFAFFCSAVLCEEVARKPKLFFVGTSTTTSTMQTASMSCDLNYSYHLHREEEKNHLLGRDGTRRSSSAVHLQEGSGEHGGLFEIAMAS